MTVLLILATFVVFLTIDYFNSRWHAVRPVVVQTEPVRRGLDLSIVAGFELPDNLRYHPGHTWALAESPNLMRLGLDDFAARLVGKAERVTLPQRNRWVRQGQKLMTVFRNGAQADLVSPMEGMITDINESVVREPGLALRDPYRDGWLVKMQAPDPETGFRNLLSGAVARKWIEEAAQRLQTEMKVMAGTPSFATAQDGGLAVHDLTAEMADADWGKLTHEFFLT